MKPIRILLFMCLVMIALLSLSWLFPEEGISLGSDITLHFLPFKQVLNPEKVEYADISKIITVAEIKPEDTVEDSLEVELTYVNFPDIDTMLSQEMRAQLHRIQFPNNDRSVLNPFFYHLRNLVKSKKLLRIIHYGDSQLEGDRMTSYIRYSLQNRFGGGGPGLLAVADIVPTSAINRSVSPNWKRFTVFGKRDTNVYNKIYGPMLSFSRYAPFEKDSILNDSLEYDAWIMLAPSNLTYASTRQFDHLKMIYNSNKSKVHISLEDLKGEVIAEDSLAATNKVSYLDLDIAHSKEPLIIRFKGKDSPDLYCLSLDNGEGIAVDNVAMRGSSGVDFNKTNLVQLAAIYKKMNVKLLIVEYGVNVVPNVLESYTFYENWFYANLRSLKNLDPELCIIVIGISDMARKKENSDSYESYPNIELIRNAQKNAAFKAGCAFWDMYAAMGGRNSMPSWVFANPPLASKDFTHFNPEGAKIIAQMFYKALIAEYDDYLRQHPVKKDTSTVKEIEKIEEAD